MSYGLQLLDNENNLFFDSRLPQFRVAKATVKVLPLGTLDIINNLYAENYSIPRPAEIPATIPPDDILLLPVTSRYYEQGIYDGTNYGLIMYSVCPPVCVRNSGTTLGLARFISYRRQATGQSLLEGGEFRVGWWS